MRFYFGVIQVLSIKSVGLFLIYCNVVVTVKGKKNVTVCSDFSTLQSPSLSARKWDLLGTHSPLRADGIVSVTLFESRHEGTVPVTYDNECPEFQTVCPGFCAHLHFLTVLTDYRRVYFTLLEALQNFNI